MDPGKFALVGAAAQLGETGSQLREGSDGDERVMC